MAPFRLISGLVWVASLHLCAASMVFALQDTSPAETDHADADHATEHAAHAVAGHATNSAGHDDAHAEHDNEPPLVPEADLVIWSLITFGVFLFALKQLAWKPLISGLDQRESKMRQAAAETEYALEKSQSLLKEHEQKLESATDEVREIIAEAKRDADRTKQDIIETAQKEADASKKRAIDDIEHARDVAMKELFDTVSNQVTSATERVVGRSVTGDDHNRLIEEALSEFDQNA